MQPTETELKAASCFLRRAKISCESVRDLFLGGRHSDASARLAEISARLEDERDFVERLIAREGAVSGNRGKGLRAGLVSNALSFE
jgi:hypothetical protein